MKGFTEALWLRKLLTELGFPLKKSCAIICDNDVAISISEISVQHDRTKHVEVDRHFIKDNLEAKIISLPFVQLKDQLTDILTKAFEALPFKETLCKWGVRDPTIQLQREC